MCFYLQIYNTSLAQSLLLLTRFVLKWLKFSIEMTREKLEILENYRDSFETKAPERPIGVGQFNKFMATVKFEKDLAL